MSGPSAHSQLLGEQLATQGQLAGKSRCKEKALWGGLSQGSPLPSGPAFSRDSRQWTLWSGDRWLRQLSGSRACAWPCSPLTGTPDPDPRSDHPGTPSLGTCPPIWTTSDSVFTRPALIFENCGTAGHWGGQGLLGRRASTTTTPALTEQPTLPLTESVSDTLCFVAVTGKEETSLPSPASLFYQTSLPECLRLLAFVPFVSG